MFSSGLTLKKTASSNTCITTQFERHVQFSISLYARFSHGIVYAPLHILAFFFIHKALLIVLQVLK